MKKSNANIFDKKDLLTIVNMDNNLETILNDLSVGERRIISIIAAIIVAGEVLIFITIIINNIH